MKLFLVSFALVLTSSAAFAADVVASQQAPVNIPDSFSWTGGYIGVNAGYAWNNNKRISDPRYYLDDDIGTFDNGWFDGEGRSNKNAFTGGIQAGYNYQVNNVVFGLETDFNSLGLKKEYAATTDQSIYAEPNYEYHLNEDLHMKSKIEWFGTIRSRIGVILSDRFLVYATGGLAYGKVKTSGGYNWQEHGYWWGGPGDHDFDRSGGFDDSSNKIRVGWTLGAGAEYALTQNISVKGEYLFVDLGKKSHVAYNADYTSELASWSERAQFSTVRLGINYKF